jgi:hypothetical protein
MLDETIIHGAANFTVESMAASLAAQRQQLFDPFDPVALVDLTVQKRSPAIDPPFGVFISINTRVGREF